MVEKKDEYLEEGKSRTRLINEYKKYGSLVIGFEKLRDELDGVFCTNSVHDVNFETVKAQS